MIELQTDDTVCKFFVIFHKSKRKNRLNTVDNYGKKQYNINETRQTDRRLAQVVIKNNRYLWRGAVIFLWLLL